MRIAFVIARIDEEKNVVQKLSLLLVKELKEIGDQVTVIPFNRTCIFKPLKLKPLRNTDAILIANVGLQCAYYATLKKIGLIKKPIVALSFGSDIRQTTNWLINIFNKISKKQVNLLIVVNPDLETIAKKRGYKHVHYVHNWAEALT